MRFFGRFFRFSEPDSAFAGELDTGMDTAGIVEVSWVRYSTNWWTPP